MDVGGAQQEAGAKHADDPADDHYWKYIFGDPAQFGVEVFSVCFEPVFMLQYHRKPWIVGGYQQIEEKGPGRDLMKRHHNWHKEETKHQKSRLETA